MVLNKFINSMKMNEDPDEYYDDEYDTQDEYYDEKPKKNVFSRQDDTEDEYAEEKPRVKSTPKVTPMKQQPKRGVSGMEVCVIKPTTVEDAREITETLLANRTVVLNLEGLDVDVAQRIIDFTSGSCFAISGNLQKISHYIFIITPSSVDISGDFQDILAGSFDVPSLNA
jgi:cell division inhibitor SepF